MKYKCTNCGNIVDGKNPPIICPTCSEIETFELYVHEEKSTRKKSTSVIKKLSEINIDDENRLFCGIKEVDRVMGNGFVKDSVNILTAPPGQGKSTLLLNIANHFAQKNKKVLYMASEESSKQIKTRAKRILEKISDNLYICDSKETNDIKDKTLEIDADILIVDSISSYRSVSLPNPAGSITQIRYCSDMIIDLCKNSTKPRMSIIIAHVTKDDELSGARTLEHDVDAVMYLEGERDDELRILRTVKNRFGELDTGLFIMGEKGLSEINDVYNYFMTRRASEDLVSGVALSMVKEGSRMITVEIEALVSRTFSPYPTRIATCLRKDNFNILISIIEQHLGIKLYDQNAIISTTGRIKLSSPATDLAIIMAIISSIKKKPISNDIMFIGEVGLTGELKRTPMIEKSIRELNRLNFKEVYVPKGNYNANLKDLNIKIIQCKNIKDVASKVGLI